MKKFEMYQDHLVRLFGGSLAKAITFQVTEDCNLACSYCYQTNKCKSKMSFETAKKFIDLLFSGDKGFKEYLQDDDTNGHIFEFIGGEPFLEIELIDKICTYIVDKMIKEKHKLLPRLRFAFASNGILYFDEKVQAFLKKFKDFISLSISIDGDKELHDSCRVFPNGEGSYDIAIKGVEDWKAKGNYMGSKMTLCPQNVDKVANAVISLINHDYDDIHLNCVYEEGWEPQHATILYYELKKLADYLIESKKDITVSMFNPEQFKPLDENYNENWCGGNGRMIAVDPKGDIFPCVRYMKSSLGDSQKPLCIGNVEDGILQSEEENKIDKCLKCITRRSQSTDECFNCPIASGCAWCTAYNYQINGDPNTRLTYICEMHKATSLANVYYWNKRKQIIGDCETFKMYLPKEDGVKIVGEEEFEMLNKLAKGEIK